MKRFGGISENNNPSNPRYDQLWFLMPGIDTELTVRDSFGCFFRTRSRNLVVFGGLVTFSWKSSVFYPVFLVMHTSHKMKLSSHPSKKTISLRSGFSATKNRNKQSASLFFLWEIWSTTEVFKTSRLFKGQSWCSSGIFSGTTSTLGIWGSMWSCEGFVRVVLFQNVCGWGEAFLE